MEDFLYSAKIREPILMSYFSEVLAAQKKVRS